MTARMHGRDHVRKDGLEKLSGAPFGGGTAFLSGAPSGKYTISGISMSYLQNLLLVKYALYLKLCILMILCEVRFETSTL